MEALGALGLLLLLANVAAHVAVVVAVVQARGLKAVWAFLLPPLALLWAWRLGARRRAMGYVATLVAFAVTVVVIRVMR